MFEDGIIIKGNREGLNVVININKYKDFADMLEALTDKLSRGKKFYKGATLKITTDLKLINERDVRKLKDVLFDEFQIKDCILDEKTEKNSKLFTGVNEGRTKFLRRTVRSGQTVEYFGNIVVIGDVNHGAEVYAAGNIIVLGSLKGHVFAGMYGNEKAIVAAFNLQPEILQIAGIVTRSPEDTQKPEYPEVAKIRENNIIVEPYLPNKYFW